MHSKYYAMTVIFFLRSAIKKASFHTPKLSAMKNVLKEVYKEIRDVTFKNLKCWFGISNQTNY